MMRRSGGILVVVVALVVLLTATAQGATTPCPMVTCAPGCEPVKQSNGCSKCACPRTCENVTCDPGYKCELQEVQCFTTPCFPQPNCVAVQESTTPCPMVTCAPGCEPVKEPNRCSRCACPRTCENVTCTEGKICVLKQVQCFRAPCFPIPSCVPQNVSEATTPCPMVTCAPGCEPVKQPNGCSKCACPRTCENVTCSKNEKCVLMKIWCITTPCFPIPTCVPKNEATTPCPMVRCAPGCELVKQTNGCSKCACPPTCKNVTCSKNEKCVLREIWCITTPCFPIPTCVPKNAATTTTPCPMIKCASGCVLVRRPNGCSRCACPRTCKNVTCSKDEKCVLKKIWCIWAPCFPIPRCVPKNESTTPAISAAPCDSEIVCGDGCRRLVDSNGCPYCDCPATCEVVDCRDGQVCRMEEYRCLTPPCPTRPVCVLAEPCPSQPPCGIRCSNGLKKDENGCYLCECA